MFLPSAIWPKISAACAFLSRRTPYTSVWRLYHCRPFTNGDMSVATTKHWQPISVRGIWTVATYAKRLLAFLRQTTTEKYESLLRRPSIVTACYDIQNNMMSTRRTASWNLWTNIYRPNWRPERLKRCGASEMLMRIISGRSSGKWWCFEQLMRSRCTILLPIEWMFQFWKQFKV
jgi:hypothetical protein